eukprot:403340857
MDGSSTIQSFLSGIRERFKPLDPIFCDNLLGVLDSLKQQNNLTYLDLSNNDLENNFLKQLVPIFKVLMEKLTYLDISSNLFTDEGLLEAKELFSNNQSLKELHCHQFQFNDVSITNQVADIIGSMINLEVLDFGWSEIQDTTLTNIVGAFACQLKKLNLSNNELTLEGAQALSEHFKKMPQNQLEELDLHHNQFEDNAKQFLMEILKDCKNLRYLNLEENFFDTFKRYIKKAKITRMYINVEIFI